MDDQIRYRGKIYSTKEINEIREVIAAHPEGSRRFISQEICRRWNWIQPNSILKDMICRGLLLQLEVQGFLKLPPRKQSPNHSLATPRKPIAVEVDETPILGPLSDLRPIQLDQVRRTPLEKLYKGAHRKISLFGIYAAGGGASGVYRLVPRSTFSLCGVVFGASTSWVPRPVFGVDPGAADEASFSGADQYPVSHITLGQGSSFSLSSFRVNGSKDFTGLGGDLSP